MTNGTITKRILKAVKTLEGAALKSEVLRQLHSFPLSSHKLVYDADAPKVPAAAWAIILEACVESDKQKLESLQHSMASMGVPYDKNSFGRYTAPTPTKSKSKKS